MVIRECESMDFCLSVFVFEMPLVDFMIKKRVLCAHKSGLVSGLRQEMTHKSDLMAWWIVVVDQYTQRNSG